MWISRVSIGHDREKRQNKTKTVNEGLNKSWGGKLSVTWLPK